MSYPRLPQRLLFEEWIKSEVPGLAEDEENALALDNTEEPDFLFNAYTQSDIELAWNAWKAAKQ